MQTEYGTFIADFKVRNRVAYLSHQETLSFWQRVLVRARLPLVFTHGFNPRPRLSLPLPRSVGVQSDCERLCALVRVDGFCPQTARRRIEAMLPAGCVLTAAETAPGKAAFYPVAATYQFLLAAPPDPRRQEHLQYCISQTRTSEPIAMFRRMENDRQRPINIRPFVETLSYQGSAVQAVCAIRPEGTVRVDELMRWLELEPHDLAEPVRRIAVRWVSNSNHFQGEYNLS